MNASNCMVWHCYIGRSIALKVTLYRAYDFMLHFFKTQVIYEPAWSMQLLVVHVQYSL